MTIAAAPGRRKAMTLLALGTLAGCAVPRPPACGGAEGSFWVTAPGWHTEIWLRAEDLAGPLARLRPLFPGAAALGFGFGKRSFMLAQADAPAEVLLGPFPGAGVVEAKGLSTLPPEAWPGGAIALALPEGGLARLLTFLEASIAADAGSLALRGSLFLDAARGYSLAYTCNTWTAEALRHAGLPVSEHGVVLAGAVLAQLAPLGCRA
ncbi:DUF2459 domain-containing protein [Paracraurococcus lichenis]|uniref:DUF2459 domain-containing protein n=1 Tax=Paracraurococcus lichenis TaxID=3064888 RepID=A0ABT9DTC2_9PROT|nr:DUF2459 domain-containing protein [Paracraurococcus sp. LOR1-02]MDO9707146.1 DUF2459 domain-containing protein [Paracraurococcus sp. LOR1-02]